MFKLFGKMIIVTGSLAFDHIMDFPGRFSDNIMPDKIHQLNLSFYLETLQKQKGGTAGNIAYNLSLFKLPVSILAAAGSDFKEYEKFLKDSGVDTSSVKIIENELTASAFIMTDQKDNQIAGFYPGAIKFANTLSIKDLTNTPSFVVIAPDNPEAMVKFSTECQDLNIPYLFDPGMQLPRLTEEQLVSGIKGAEILIGNDYEIELLSNKLQVTSDKLLEQVKILITTLGEKGSVIQTAGNTALTPGESPSTGSTSQFGPELTAEGLTKSPLGTGKPTPGVSLPGRWQVKAGKPEQVLDPTGAGDAYRAGFLAGFIKGFNLKTCGQMGSVASCYAVEKYGTTSHRFTVSEFCERYEENFGEKLELSS